MGLVVVRQELRHGAAIALGHEGVLAPGIIALLDGDGLIKPLPQPPERHLLITGQRQLQAVHGQDAGVALCVDQQLPVGAVVDKEGFVGVAVAEVPPQQGQNPVFGLDFRP